MTQPVDFLHVATHILRSGKEACCPIHTPSRVIPEHGCDHLPGEREHPDPDTGDCDSLQKLVELMVCERCNNRQKAL